MHLRLVPFKKTGRTGLERIRGLGSDAGRLVCWFQQLLYICRFYDLKFEISRGKIKFMHADGEELRGVEDNDRWWEFRNINDMAVSCNRLISNRGNHDAREFDQENWKDDLDNSFFNEI